MFSLDVSGAHKSIRTAAADVGYSVFRVGFVRSHFLEKLQLEDAVSYLGWNLNLAVDGFWASIAPGKLDKIGAFLDSFLSNSKKMQRRELQKFLGLLIWATQVQLLCRPFLAPLFRCLCRPSQKLQCLSLEQVEELVSLLDEKLEARVAAKRSDVQAGWKLVAIGASACHNAKEVQAHLRQPKLKNGRVWARFSAWGATLKLDRLQLAALKFLKSRFERPCFAMVAIGSPLVGAADAWADATKAGLGGWCAGASGDVKWFHLELVGSDLPAEWEFPHDLQKGIAALELVAQQILVQIRGTPQKLVVRQFCDNMGAVGSLTKGLCTSFPLGAVLMNLSLVCLERGCELELSHVAGERNIEADALSRLNAPVKPDQPCLGRFHCGNRVAVTAKEVFAPWKKLMGCD
eukprot:Skav217069  [mRNA]  locus=scaffold1308:3342:4762:+ [translate_table: standard]